MLEAAGIDVTFGVLQSEADYDHVGFFGRVRHKRPYVTLKIATTIDGQIATKTGESQWITGPDARLAVHAMRARHDAVMVGSGTLRADDPQLTVRGMGTRRQPVRVIVSSDLNLPLTSGMFHDTDQAPVWVCHGPAESAQFEELGVKCIPTQLQGGRVDVTAALAALADQGLTRVFCEGGGGLAASLLQAGLVDQLEVFQAGKVIGGDGLAAVAAMGLNALADAPQFQRHRTRRLGGDIPSTWRRA
jgi:diaminohydroxyphosphoribosylaminopyrimidine deaminase/5-amino-6-(5-phosphoribosylamino)uracil reductase